MKIFTKLKQLIIALLLTLPLANGYAAGTISLANSFQTRFTWFPYSTRQPVVFGVFWGTNRHENPSLTWELLTWAEPGQLWPGSVSGLINVPPVYSIPNTEPGQVVYLQIRGWLASYGNDWERARRNYGDYAETAVLPVVLGPEAGPGTSIWQSVGGTSADRFYPLQFGRPLSPYNRAGFGNVRSLTVDEGDQGSITVAVPVKRSGSSLPELPNLGLGESVTVLLSTSNITATAGQDYTPVNIPVTFAAGVTEQQVLIKITADPVSEEDEQFSVHLSYAGSFVNIDYSPFIVTIREARIRSVSRTGGASVITLRTSVGQRYALQVSTDLASWSTLEGFENIVGDGSVMELTDPDAGCCEQRFYRVELVTPTL